MTTQEDDAVTVFLKELIQEHPGATDDEIWELFRPAAKNNDEIKATIVKFYAEKFYTEKFYTRRPPVDAAPTAVQAANGG